jgi:hypothetical protein
MPFMVKSVLTPFFISTPTSKVEGVNQMITTMHHTLKLFKESMQSAQDWAKFYKDKNCTPQEFEVND